MKKNGMALIKVAVFCFVMMAAGPAWSENKAANGTILDTSTGLVWLQNANCFGSKTYTDAKASVANLKSGDCGLTDSSTAGQWRLPTLYELSGLKQSGFTNVILNFYWTDTTFSPGFTWIVHTNGEKGYKLNTGLAFVWPVRGTMKKSPFSFFN